MFLRLLFLVFNHAREEADQERHEQASRLRRRRLYEQRQRKGEEAAVTAAPRPTAGLRGPAPRQSLDRARRLATPKTAKGLSRSNLIATCGFLVLSTLGTALAFNDKLLRPLAILGDLAVTEATLDNDYMQRVTTRGSIKTSSYQVVYTYVVDGKTYTGSSVTSEVPHVMMPVQYLKAQPGTSGMEMRGNAIIDLCIFGVPYTVLVI